jgi:PiT family inorganic phosphate transporter
MVVVLRFAAHSQNVERLNRRFRRLQLISAGAYSLGHGGNDAQKTMGVILALLIATHKVAPTADVPIWVVLAAHSAIALGTLSGGWRVVHTLGSRITKLQPSGGVAAESAAAATLFFVSAHGIPVSTTHTITGAIIGVGSIQRLSAVRWGVAGRVVWAWILTIPGAAIVSALAYTVLRAF